MKVEYSYFGDNPSLIIKGTDFLKAMKDDDELYLLKVAVDGFCAEFEVESHFKKHVNDVIDQWILKNSEIIYSIKDRIRGNVVVASWCEVYVHQEKRFINIVTSENGRNFDLHNKE